MKRIISIYLCLVLFACVPAARREEAVRPTATTPDGSAATAIPTESPAAIADVLAEPDRFPVTEASIALPTTVEPVNLEDHLLVYESDGATYLYAYGESVLLHQGMPLFDVEVGAGTVGMERAALGVAYHDVDGCRMVIVHSEIEGRDANRNGDIYIVGIDDRKSIHNSCIVWTGGTGC